MRRSKHQGEMCWACDRPLKRDQKVCSCGTPTRTMSFEERTAYEVEMWRASKQEARTA